MATEEMALHAQVIDSKANIACLNLQRHQANFVHDRHLVYICTFMVLFVKYDFNKKKFTVRALLNNI